MTPVSWRTFLLDIWAKLCDQTNLRDDVMAWKVFRITGPLWGKPPVTGGFPHKEPVMLDPVLMVWSNSVWKKHRGVSCTNTDQAIKAGGISASVPRWLKY